MKALLTSLPICRVTSNRRRAPGCGTARYSTYPARSNLNRSRLIVFAGAGLILFAHPALAQLAAREPKPPLDNAAVKNRSDSRIESERVDRDRRAQARALLISLASDARSFRDQTLRARSLARIADALWEVDAADGRTLFRKSWEAAETADKNPGPYTLGQTLPNLRGEVIKLAARRDRLLAEEFLQKLKSDQPDSKAENSTSSLWALPEALQQRLNLAQSLLRTGDVVRALQFADPALGSVTISTVEFLTDLREKDPAAADQRYAAMLANTGGNMLADPNTVSLLSSYVFTPHLYVIFNTEGSASWSMPPSSFPRASVDPQLRLAFFQTAASVLLRPTGPPPEPDPSHAGIAGKYMIVKRLMPLFEQYAPREITETMRGQFEALNSVVSAGLRQGENEWTQKGISPEKSGGDQEQSLFDQIDHARTSDERDQLYFKLALLALSKDDLKGRDYVTKIDESEFRKQAQAWVDWGLATEAIRKKKIESALELARTGELTHMQRVWLLTQTAKLLVKTDRDKALSLLDDATSEIRRIEGADPYRARGLLAIANALTLIEPSLAWDAVFDAVKAANSTEGFSGEDGVLTQTIRTTDAIRVNPNAVPDFDIAGIFGKLASDDYDRIVQLARGYQGEAPRANATIAIARSVLNQKRPPAPTRQPAAKN
jgi:hypothetical protein